MSIRGGGGAGGGGAGIAAAARASSADADTPEERRSATKPAAARSRAVAAKTADTTRRAVDLRCTRFVVGVTGGTEMLSGAMERTVGIASGTGGRATPGT